MEIKTPVKRKRINKAKIRDDAINVKRFVRLDVGGRDLYESVYKLIDDEIVANGGSLGKKTKLLVAKAMIMFTTKQLDGIRDRVRLRLDSIIQSCE